MLSDRTSAKEAFVGFLGPLAFVRTQWATARSLPGIVVQGCWCGPEVSDELPDGLQLHGSPTDLLRMEQLDAIAVGAPLAERAYWCEQVAGAGKLPICEAPPGQPSEQATAALAACAAAGRPLRLVDRSDVGEIARELDSAGTRCGRLVFFALDVQLSRQELAADEHGVLPQGAVGYLGRLPSVHGPLESVWAESRSLLWGRPAEDVAVAYLRAVDGCEGVVSVSGLGERTRASLRVHGRWGSAEYEDADAAGMAAAWRCAYADLVPAAAPRQAALPLSAAQLDAGLLLANWIRRAARARRPLHRKEAGP